MTDGDYKVYTTKYDKTLTAQMYVHRILRRLKKSRDKCAAENADPDVNVSVLPFKDYAEAQLSSVLSSYRKDWLDNYSNVDFPETGVVIPPKTAVKVLFDMSGSVRGRPANNLCALADTFMKVSRDNPSAQISISGHTTLEWMGGQSRRDWFSNDRPRFPGRLNDLAYINFKTFDDTVNLNHFKGLAAFLTAGTLKENIDGEALLRAQSELEAQDADHKILLFVSDNAPADNSTLSFNPSDCLDKHLDEVCHNINFNSDVKLVHFNPLESLKEKIEAHKNNGHLTSVNSSIKRYPRQITSLREDAAHGLSEEMRRVVQATYNVSQLDVCKSFSLVMDASTAQVRESSNDPYQVLMFLDRS